MKISARPLLVLHGDPAFRERVRAVAGRAYQYQAVADWPSLVAVVRDSPPSALVIVDPFFDGTDQRVGAELRSFASEFPSTPILAALRVAAGRSEDLVRLGKAGIVDIISIGHDDTPEALRHRLARAEGRPLKLLLENTLPVDLPGRARAIIDAAAQIVSAGGHGRDLAAALHLSRRTLLRWSESAMLPPPRRLLAWMRILLAAELLDDPGRTVLGVAQATGYSSDSGLRRVTMKFTQSSPTDLRRRGAFAAASKHFLRELERYRTTTTGGGDSTLPESDV
jgi:AraC-like DNA-binding protein